MSTKATSGGDFQVAPSGTHLAICVQVVDLGTQYSKFYDKSSHKVMVGWELCGEFKDDEEGKPFLVWHRYTASTSSKSNLRRDLEAWRGKKFTKEEIDEFEIAKVLDKPCQVSISHSEPDKDNNVYANVTAVTGLPKGVSVPERVHPLIHFDIDRYLEGDAKHVKAFEGFSESLQKTISESVEMSDAKRKPAAGSTKTSKATHQEHEALGDDDIPF